MRNFKIKSLLKNQIGEKEFVNFEQAKTVFVILASDSMVNLAELTRLVKQEFAGKELKIWAFINKIHKNETADSIRADKVLTGKNVNIFGVVKSEILREIQAGKFDLLVNLDTAKRGVVDTLVAACNAKMKCGACSNFPKLLDFMIDLPSQKDEKELLAQILFYLKKIRAKK